MHSMESLALLAMEFLPPVHVPLKSLQHGLDGPGSKSCCGVVGDSRGAHANLAGPLEHQHRPVRPVSTPTARPPNGQITGMCVDIDFRARCCRLGTFSNCRVTTKLAFSPGGEDAISAISFTTHPDLIVKLETPTFCCMIAHHPMTVLTGNELLESCGSGELIRQSLSAHYVAELGIHLTPPPCFTLST